MSWMAKAVRVSQSAVLKALKSKAAQGPASADSSKFTHIHPRTHTHAENIFLRRPRIYVEALTHMGTWPILDQRANLTGQTWHSRRVVVFIFYVGS